jgi:preprotein translocase subunit YajC
VIEFLAAAATTAPAGTESPLYSMTHGMMPVLLIVLVVYMAMMMLPKRRQDKERQNMLSNMKRGDEIQTIGGIIGKVVEAREDRVLVKVDESSNSKIWFTRGSIARVTAEDTKEAKAAAASK